MHTLHLKKSEHPPWHQDGRVEPGGQQQRIALARAIVHKPKLIICDEPTSSLDHANGVIVMELLKSHALNPENAVIVATHDKRILEYADRVVELDDGNIEKVYETKVCQ